MQQYFVLKLYFARVLKWAPMTAVCFWAKI